MYIYNYSLLSPFVFYVSLCFSFFMLAIYLCNYLSESLVVDIELVSFEEFDSSSSLLFFKVFSNIFSSVTFFSTCFIDVIIDVRLNKKLFCFLISYLYIYLVRCSILIDC